MMENSQYIKQRLTIAFSPREKAKIKFVANKLGFGSCSSMIRHRILSEVNQFIAQYHKEKIEKMAHVQSNQG